MPICGWDAVPQGGSPSYRYQEPYTRATTASAARLVCCGLWLTPFHPHTRRTEPTAGTHSSVVQNTHRSDSVGMSISALKNHFHDVAKNEPLPRSRRGDGGAGDVHRRSDGGTAAAAAALGSPLPRSLRAGPIASVLFWSNSHFLSPARFPIAAECMALVAILSLGTHNTLEVEETFKLKRRPRLSATRPCGRALLPCSIA